MISIFNRKEKKRLFHVVFSATFEKGIRVVSAEMEVSGKGFVQSHILDHWRSILMRDVNCKNAIITNFIEISE